MVITRTVFASQVRWSGLLGDNLFGCWVGVGTIQDLTGGDRNVGGARGF